ncbi:MAG: DNA translocase FtsK 4TM domain-containing protein [Lachnospiraceae bacterium]
MATTTKKATTKKSSSKKKTTTTRKSTPRKKRMTAEQRKKLEREEMIRNEIMVWGTLAFCVILFLSDIGCAGKIGNALSYISFGLFGIVSYLLPFAIFLTALFVISNKETYFVSFKVIIGCIFLWFLCTFSELFLANTTSFGIETAWKYAVSTHRGGGLFGGFLAQVLYNNLGLVGAYVIAVIGLILSLALLTEQSIFARLKKGGQKIYDSAKTDAQRRQKKREMRQQFHEEQRAQANKDRQKKVSGVTMDLDLKKQSKSEETEKILDIPIQGVTPIEDVENVQTEIIEEPQTFSDVDIFEETPDDVMPVDANEPVILPLPEMSVSDSVNRTDEPKEDILCDEKDASMHLLEPLQETGPEDVSTRKNPKQSPEEINETVQCVEKEMKQVAPAPKKYIFPSIRLLQSPDRSMKGDSVEHVQQTAKKLEQTLKNFGVNVKITNASQGPSVTRYELQPEQGVKVSKIVNLSDDIKLNLAAPDIRIEAPIPGKAAVGIEVPNKQNVTVNFRELVESTEFKRSKSPISFAVGKDIAGNPVVADIAKMPHLLIAGATGSGKSVCINTIIMSILYKADPSDVKLIMIDPKVVELSVYNGIPHLFIPVVTDAKKAAGALHWAVSEMMERYEKFAAMNVRDLKGYNKKAASMADSDTEEKPEKMPQIVIIVDELADLMMVAPGDVEDAICRLAQLARAAGIHLILATQRPSVNVITGLIKANMPSRIAFSVSSGVDSRTILDMNGAEKLLGKGDMLFYPQGSAKPRRVQGAFVSDQEVAEVVAFLTKENGETAYNQEIESKMQSVAESSTGNAAPADDRDQYFVDAGRFLIEKNKASIGLLQRNFRIGFNRAARIMGQLEDAGVVGPEDSTKPRQILMSEAEFETYVEECV